MANKFKQMVGKGGLKNSTGGALITKNKTNTVKDMTGKNGLKNSVGGSLITKNRTMKNEMVGMNKAGRDKIRQSRISRTAVKRIAK